MRYLLALLFPLVAFGQGFGNFRTDQPFLAASAVADGPISSPTDIANLVFWADFTTNTYVFSDTNRVTAANNNDPLRSATDRSGQGNHLWVGSSTSTVWNYFVNYVGGWAAGAGWNNATTPGLMQIAKVPASRPVWSSPNTYFLLVYKWGDGETTLLNSQAPGAAYAETLTLTMNSSLAADGHLVDTNQAYASSGATVHWRAVKQVWYLITVQQNGASSLIRTNGALLANCDLSHSNASGQVGLQVGGGSDGFNGEFLQVLVYNAALTSNQIYKVEHWVTNYCRGLVTLPN